MPNIKISELTAPIAVTDSDILPVVQSSVTRKITWGLLKAALGLGTAATSNKQTSATDTTAGALVIQGGTNRATLDTVAIGYGTGSGGTVTQATSKSTAVTLNKPSGRVTTTADSLAAGAGVSFQLTNSKIAATDIVLVSSISGPGAASYTVSSWGVSAGFCYIRIENISAATAAHAISINFVVIKGATA